jgi:F-type H+-transporting ATPase subunit gamma
MTSMQDIRGIVHTMKTLSVINSAPYEHAATAIAAYHETVLLGLHALLSQVGSLDASSVVNHKRSYVVFGSDHGLCGNYNEALATHLAQLVADAPEEIIILCVGAQMGDALRNQGIVPHATLLPPASVDGIGRLANQLTRQLAEIQTQIRAGDIAISLAFVMRDRAVGQRPEVADLLPFDPEFVRDLQGKPWNSRSLPSFSMPSSDLFQTLVRGHLFASIFRAAAEALVTENAARLAQMQQAEQSVDERLYDLGSEVRSVRQSEITTELMDVIIGFEALRKKRCKTTAGTLK